MKKIVLATMFSIVATAAFASGTKIVNNSGLPIDELTVSAPGKQTWSDNIMKGVPEGALDAGKSYAINGLSAGVWDIKIDAPDEGVSCVLEKVTVKAGKPLVLTPEMGKSCK